MDGSVNFYRKYRNYKLGFGNVKAGEFWLGNDNIHVLTNLHHANELRVDMESVSNEKTFAHYGNFSVASETDGYRLTVGGFLGTSVAGKKPGEVTSDRAVLDTVIHIWEFKIDYYCFRQLWIWHLF